MRPVFVGPSQHSPGGPGANGVTRPGLPAAGVRAVAAIATIVAVVGLAASYGYASSSRYTAAAAPVGIAQADGSATGPRGGSAEAGFGSTGASPSESPPRWAHEVMPTPIEDDPFFDYPADVSGLAPGEVIRERAATTSQVQLPPNNLHQFMFRSTDAHGEPIPATASILVPQAPWTGDGPRPVVANAVAIDSLGAECTPSYTVVHRSFNIEIPPFTPTLLERGYAVLLPDHEGPDMAYAAGILAGHIVLDSIRAMNALPDVETTVVPEGSIAGLPGSVVPGSYAPPARNAEPDRREPDRSDAAASGGPGQDTTSPVVINGYSGGAIAAGWAAQLQPTYAPEVSLAGVAAGGTPSDLSLLPKTMNGTLGTGLFLAASFGLAREYPQLLTNLNDFGQTMARSPLKDQCIEAVAPLGASMLPISTFTFPGVLSSPDVRAVMAENRLGRLRPDAPVLLYQGSSDVFLGDEFIPESGVRALHAEWCRLGADVKFVPVAGEHFSAAVTGMPMLLDWLAARLAGVPQQSDCAAPQPVAPAS